MGAHTPGGNLTALYLQAVDKIFVQIVGSGNDRIRETCLIQHFPGLLGKICQVAAVQADTVEGEGDTRLPHFRKDADGIGYA